MLRIVAVSVLLMLAGCASTAPTLTQRPAQAAHADYTINGRIAVKYNGERSSANLHWTHHDEADDILLLAPLGVTVAHIWHDATGMKLDASGKHYEARGSDELMQRVLGWSLPLDGLQYWVRALPRPSAKFEEQRDERGRLSKLQQDGWNISYTRYAAEGADSLAMRMMLQHENLEIVLVVDEWGAP